MAHLRCSKNVITYCQLKQGLIAHINYHSHSKLTNILRAGLTWAQTYNILPDRLTRAFPRPGSEAIVHISPTEFEFRQTPIT